MERNHHVLYMKKDEQMALENTTNLNLIYNVPNILLKFFKKIIIIKI